MVTLSSSLLTLEQALATMLDAVDPVTVADTENVPLTEACGRISAEPIVSPVNIPPFDNSSMDGYAVRLADLTPGAFLPVAGQALAGVPFTGQWPAGSALRIMAGSPTPAGAEAVIMQKYVQVDEQGVRFSVAPAAGEHIRRVGDDIRQGDEVSPEGRLLQVAELPLLASLGIASVRVCRRLRVALFSTGDELRPIGDPLAAGEIHDTNRFAIRLMLTQLGCEVIDLGIIADDAAVLREAFRQADSRADLLITSVGVSVGEADYTKTMLEELGQIHFWKLAMKPGKPFAFGRLSQAWFCGLPGNPVSAAITFYQLVQPLIARLRASGLAPAAAPARSLTPLGKNPSRLDFQRSRYRLDDAGELTVETTVPQGSHVFSSLSSANCFIVLEQVRGPLRLARRIIKTPGDKTADFLSLPHLHRAHRAGARLVDGAIQRR